jgi:hypothetical protein
VLCVLSQNKIRLSAARRIFCESILYWAFSFS